MTKRGRLINIAGPSAGVGKTAIIAELVKNKKLHLVRLKTYITRKQRSGDKHDQTQYHFVSKRRFAALKKQKFFLETKRLHREWYGSPIHDMRELLVSGKNVVTTIDAQRIKILKRTFPHMIAIFIDASDEALRARMKTRGDMPIEIATRLRLAARERAWKTEYDKIFRNENKTLDQVVSEVAKYLQKRLK